MPPDPVDILNTAQHRGDLVYLSIGILLFSGLVLVAGGTFIYRLVNHAIKIFSSEMARERELHERTIDKLNLSSATRNDNVIQALRELTERVNEQTGLIREGRKT